MALKPGNLPYGGGVSSKSKYNTDTTVTGLDQLIENLNSVGELISLKAARAIGLIAIDLLSNTQPRVPIDTGELRESGVAVLKLGRARKLIIGTGNADGTVSADLGGIKKAKLAHVRTIRSEVSYSKMKDDFDVAVYAHEQLAPYNGEHGTKDRPIAQTPGTGPKYLDIPWRQKKSTYIKFLKDAVSGNELNHDIQQITKIKQRRVGKFTVDIVELSKSKINSLGYNRIRI